MTAQRIIRGVDPDSFRLGVIVDGLKSAFATVARRFHAASLSNRGNYSIGVDPDDPGLQCACHAQGASAISRKNTGSKAMFAVVCQTQNFLFVVEAEYAEDGAKQFRIYNSQILL